MFFLMKIRGFMFILDDDLPGKSTSHLHCVTNTCNAHAVQFVCMVLGILGTCVHVRVSVSILCMWAYVRYAYIDPLSLAVSVLRSIDIEMSLDKGLCNSPACTDFAMRWTVPGGRDSVIVCSQFSYRYLFNIWFCEFTIYLLYMSFHVSCKIICSFMQHILNRYALLLCFLDLL